MNYKKDCNCTLLCGKLTVLVAPINTLSEFIYFTCNFVDPSLSDPRFGQEAYFGPWDSSKHKQSPDKAGTHFHVFPWTHCCCEKMPALVSTNM